MTRAGRALGRPHGKHPGHHDHGSDEFRECKSITGQDPNRQVVQIMSYPATSPTVRRREDSVHLATQSTSISMVEKS